LIGFRNGVLDTRTGLFSLHNKKHWLRTLCEVDYTQPVDAEVRTELCLAFCWLDRAQFHTEKRTLFWQQFMVLANRYDWQLFLEVTGPGKAILAEIATCGKVGQCNFGNDRNA
jgi:putative DNA primase/helicase